MIAEDSSKMAHKYHILLLNGPNMNLLGSREPDKYGYHTLDSLTQAMLETAQQLGVKLSYFQSNAEHALIERIHQAANNIDYIIINPAAFTHTSVAIRDALLAVAIPFIEVHMTNIHAREAFRRRSWFSDISAGVICGLGTDGYLWALQTTVKRLTNLNILSSE